MELRVLRYFLAVARYQNMTKAAQELLVSQPTLSKQLTDLENELGVKLFYRDHRSMTLTDQGRYLQSRAKEIVELADQTANNIQVGNNISGTLSIGAGESMAMNRIMQVIDVITQKYSDIKIKLISGNADEMKNALWNGLIDFAVLMGEQDLTRYNHLQLPDENRWGLVLRRDDPLAKKEVITANDIIGLPILISEQGLEEHRFQNWWGNLSQQMNIVGTYTLAFNGQFLVNQGHVYMVTYEHLINNSLNQQLVFRPLSPEIVDPTNIVWKRDVVQSAVAQLFLQRLKATL